PRLPGQQPSRLFWEEDRMHRKILLVLAVLALVAGIAHAQAPTPPATPTTPTTPATPSTPSTPTAPTPPATPVAPTTLNLSGVWNVNLAKSDYGMAPPPTSRTETIEQT